MLFPPHTNRSTLLPQPAPSGLILPVLVIEDNTRHTQANAAQGQQHCGEIQQVVYDETQADNDIVGDENRQDYSETGHTTGRHPHGLDRLVGGLVDQVVDLDDPREHETDVEGHGVLRWVVKRLVASRLQHVVDGRGRRLGHVGWTVRL